MVEITGANGADIQIGVAGFKDVIDLKNSMVKELAKVGISIGETNLGKKSAEELLKTEVNDGFLNSILKPVAMIDSSDEFYKCVFKCMLKSTYNGEKITEKTFEDEQAREDYYTIVMEVLKVNLAPFFKGFVSGFLHLIPVKKETTPE